MQFANVSTRETINVIVVFCAFIPGSDAQGCAVELTGHVDNITVNLTRESNSREAVALYELPRSLYCYHQAHAFDIEADGSVGTLPVPVVLLYNNQTRTSQCIMTEVNPEGPPRIGVISAVSALAVIISVVIIVMIIIIFLYEHSRKQGESPIYIFVIH